MDITESFNIKLEDYTFGTNAPEYDNGNIKLFSFQRTIYTACKVDDKVHVVAVSLVTNDVSIAVVNATDNIESLIRNGLIHKKMYNIPALRNFNVCFNLLCVILSKYHMRIPTLVFTARDNISITLIERIMRLGVFRTSMKKYRYGLDKFAEPNNKSLQYILKK